MSPCALPPACIAPVVCRLAFALAAADAITAALLIWCCPPNPPTPPGGSRPAPLFQLLANDDFVVVHAENAAAKEWEADGHGYAPQTYFYAPGEEVPLPILGTSESSPHFFHDEATLVWGARKALEVVKSGARSNPTGQATEMKTPKPRTDL